MGRFVIAAYAPREGKEEELAALTREHVPILRAEGLATDSPSIAMRAKDGTIVEVFEWTSEEAIASAHTSPAVLALWQRYEAISTYRKLEDLSEVHDMWASFEPLD